MQKSNWRQELKLLISIFELFSSLISRLWSPFPVEHSSVCLLFVCEVQKVYFDQEWSKRRKNHLDDFKEQSNNIFPYWTLGLLSLLILRLWSPFFPIEYPAHISCSFVRSHLLFICKVYTGVFWSRMEWKKKKEKTHQIISAYRPDSRCQFELCW